MKSFLRSFTTGVLLAFACTALRADQNLAGNVTITGGSASGDLIVTGDVYVAGTYDSADAWTKFDNNELRFGGATGVNNYGASLNYQDADNDTFTFALNRTPASWLWLHATSGANPSGKAMRLDANHQLTLFKSDGATTGISLLPSSNPQLTLGTASLTGSGSVLSTSGPLSVAGDLTNTTGSIKGGSSGLTLDAGTTGQNITLTAAGSGDLVFNTGGFERARIKSTGNVGIGVSSPVGRFNVVGSGGAGQGVQIDTGEIKIRGDGYAHYSLLNTSGTFSISDTSSTLVMGATGSPRLAISSAGNVGIGTNAPFTKVDVRGASATAGATIQIVGTGVSSLLLGQDASGGVIRGQGGSNSLRFLIGGNPDQAAAATGTEAMRILGSGNVGIGTTAPVSKLHVIGPDVPLVVESTTTNAYVSLRNSAGDNSISANGNVLYIGGGGIASPIYFRNGWAVNMVQTADGKVGIGTPTPATTLHVLGQTAREVVRLQGSADVSDNRNFFSLYTTNPNYWWEFSNQDPQGGGTLNGLAFRERSASGNSIERVYFASGGNVGIGTTSPTHKLSVKGAIRANEVIVDTGWADYVFDESYRLAPLSEVEAHIKTAKHLPGIPSAAEVAEHGVSMGDMQSKLLSKIEELTLHLIAQEKQIAALRQEVAALKRSEPAQ